uniref:HAT C-terminal dimerisation domain-containing protein n=1 Tax=Trichuris muris TaxID=70415 RepID=A0A5S6QTX4_TRIMR
MNLLLQGDDLNLIKTKSVISAFVSKLLFFKHNLIRGKFYNFPNLCEVRNKGQTSEEDIEVYWQHLVSFQQDFIERFQDILSLEVSDWEELLELQVNEELKPKFKLGYRTFWLQRDISRLYPRLRPIVRNLLISFPSSYLVGRGFSVVADLLTKKRNKLQIANHGDLRLWLTSIEQNVEKLLLQRGFQV